MSTIEISTVDLYFTGFCNYKCEYCYGENDINPHMTKETYLQCLDFAQQINATTIEFCGGEPLLNPLFEEAVRLAKARGFQLILRTNGIYLGKHLDLIAENFEWIGISLDGLVEANARMRPAKNKISKEDQFHLPIANMKALKEKNPNIKILLATVASAVNYSDIPAFAQYVEEHQLPINKWKIYQFIKDKFRSEIYEDKYALPMVLFEEMKNRFPSTLLKKTEVQFQSSNVEGVSGNCLIVLHNGQIQIMKKIYGQIGVNTNEEIIDNLKNSPVLTYIQKNKNVTYQK